MKLVTKIQLRRDTAENLADVVLEEGEPAYATDTGVFAIGDGVTEFALLGKYSSSASFLTLEQAGFNGTDIRLGAECFDKKDYPFFIDCMVDVSGDDEYATWPNEDERLECLQDILSRFSTDLNGSQRWRVEVAVFSEENIKWTFTDLRPNSGSESIYTFKYNYRTTSETDWERKPVELIRVNRRPSDGYMPIPELGVKVDGENKEIIVTLENRYIRHLEKLWSMGFNTYIKMYTYNAQSSGWLPSISNYWDRNFQPTSWKIEKDSIEVSEYGSKSHYSLILPFSFFYNSTNYTIYDENYHEEVRETLPWPEIKFRGADTKVRNYMFNNKTCVDTLDDLIPFQDISSNYLLIKFCIRIYNNGYGINGNFTSTYKVHVSEEVKNSPANIEYSFDEAISVVREG